jgi:hypothetical protein
MKAVRRHEVPHLPELGESARERFVDRDRRMQPQASVPARHGHPRAQMEPRLAVQLDGPELRRDRRELRRRINGHRQFDGFSHGPSGSIEDTTGSPIPES